jgi:diguanylate cyclase (GGDEF)-like protein
VNKWSPGAVWNQSGESGATRGADHECKLDAAITANFARPVGADALPRHGKQANADPALEAQVLSERLRLLAKQSRGIMFPGLVGAIMLGTIHWHVVEHARVVEWVLLIASADVLNFLCCNYWLRHSGETGNSRRSLYSMLSTILCTGVAWGCAAPLLYVPGRIEYEFMTQLFLGAVTMSTVACFSTFWIVILTRAIALWAPVMFHTLGVGDRLHLYLSASDLVFVGAIAQFGWSVGREHTDGLYHLFENRLLSSRLAESQDRLARSNEELQRNNAALQTALQRIEDLAVRDELTGVHNRRFLTSRLGIVCEQSRRRDRAVSIAILDVDHFKLINDSHGHNTGDEVLKFLATEICSRLRPDDIFARYGGEEFVCLLPDTAADGAALLGEHMRNGVAEASPLRAPSRIAITISVGVAEFDPAETAQDWLRRADEALYRAKREGRNRVVVAPPSPVAAHSAAPMASASG